MQVTSAEIIKKAKSCIRQKRNLVSAQVAMGIALFEQGDIQEAIKHYSKAISLDEYSAEANAGLGISYARLHDREKSLLHLEKALKLSPECGLLANWLADAHFDMGQFDKAIELYSLAISIDSSDSNAHNDLADVYRLKGDYESALGLYKKTLAIDPYDTNAMLEMAQCQIKLNKISEAQQWLSHLIEKFPGSRDCATALAVTGSLQLQNGQSEEAYNSFVRAVKFFPFNCQLLFQAAICANKVGKPAECKVFLKKILDLNPDDKRALALLKKVDANVKS